jgi:hypothetical protein
MSRSAITLESRLRVTDAERGETLATIRKTYLDEVEGSDWLPARSPKSVRSPRLQRPAPP